MSTNTSSPHPLSVTILALLALAVGGFNLLRFVLSLQQWSYLKTLPAVSPLYLAASGLVWALACMPLAWGMLRGLPWAPRLMQALALSYALYYWLDQIFLADHPASLPAETGLLSKAFLPANWPFAAGVTIALLAWMVWVLNRPKVKAFFDNRQAEHAPAEEQQEHEVV